MELCNCGLSDRCPLMDGSSRCVDRKTSYAMGEYDTTKKIIDVLETMVSDNTNPGDMLSKIKADFPLVEVTTKLVTNK